jgi:hypothetical protein
MRQPGTAAAAQAPTLRLLLNVVNFSPFRSATIDEKQIVSHFAKGGRYGISVREPRYGARSGELCKQICQDHGNRSEEQNIGKEPRIKAFCLRLLAESAHALYKISVGRRIFAILHNCESSVEGLSSIGGTFDLLTKHRAFGSTKQKENRLSSRRAATI